MFPPVFLPECGNELVMCGESAVIVDDRLDRVAFGKVAGGVAVPLGFSAIQAVLNHCPAHQRGRKRVSGLKSVSCRREHMVGISVQLVRPCRHDPCVNGGVKTNQGAAQKQTTGWRSGRGRRYASRPGSRAFQGAGGCRGALARQGQS